MDSRSSSAMSSLSMLMGREFCPLDSCSRMGVNESEGFNAATLPLLGTEQKI